MENIKRALVDWWGSGKWASVVQSSTDPTKNALVVTNPDGSSVWSKVDSLYKIRDIDKWATYTYYWKQSSSWAWFIMRKTNATKVFEYAYWASDYSTWWSWRVSLSYWDVQ